MADASRCTSRETTTGARLSRWFAERQHDAAHDKGAAFAMIVVVDPRDRSLIVNAIPTERANLHLARPFFGLPFRFFLGPMQAPAPPHGADCRAVPSREQKRRPTDAILFPGDHTSLCPVVRRRSMMLRTSTT